MTHVADDLPIVDMEEMDDTQSELSDLERRMSLVTQRSKVRPFLTDYEYAGLRPVGHVELVCAAISVVLQSVGLGFMSLCTITNGLFILLDGYWTAAAYIVGAVVLLLFVERRSAHLEYLTIVTGAVVAVMGLAEIVIAGIGLFYLNYDDCRYEDYQVMLMCRILMMAVGCFACFSGAWTIIVDDYSTV